MTKIQALATLNEFYHLFCAEYQDALTVAIACIFQCIEEEDLE